MLKKAGIAVAITTAGLLALSPMAFAKDKEHQDNTQTSTQGEGDENGQNIESGGAFQLVCNENVDEDNTGTVTQGGGACNNVQGPQEGQVEKQHQREH